MSHTHNQPYPREGIAVPSLPVHKPFRGGVTQWRLYRMIVIYLIMAGSGLYLTQVFDMAAIGLSMIIPGGGLLHYASGDAGMISTHVLLFIAVQLVFVIALLFWVATGNLMAPILVWVLAGVWAASMDHGHHMQGPSWAYWGVPLMAMGGFALYSMLQHRKKQYQQKKRDQLNTQLTNVVTAVTPLDEKGLPQTKELTPDELAFSRFFYDRALQPVDGFGGFDQLDQFREAAYRYQIFYLSNALSIKAAVATPALRAYHDQAQDNLMQKMLLHPVWGYWQIENIWGNFNADPNPLPNDNVMYTGWYAAAMGVYISNSGTQKYNAPGSLKLRNKQGDVAYETSFPELCDTLLQNYQRSDYTLFACEPKFIYPICSGFGATALKMYDRLYDEQHWSQIAQRYKQALEDEFITIDGRVTAIRCYRTGVTVPGLTSAMADAAASFYLNGYFPDIARRSWEVARNSLLDVHDGRPVLQKSAWDRIDFGNYRAVPAATNGLFAMAAREMGDDEVANMIITDTNQHVENRIYNGVKHYKGVSVGGHAAMFGATIGRTNAVHDMIAVGPPDEWKQGPMLAEADYPDVLVAKAVSDGVALHLVLYPGTAKQRVQIGISQLRPNAGYRLEGVLNDNVVASAQGTLKITLPLDHRTELFIKPRA